MKKLKERNQPQPLELQEALLQPPPPIGLAELIENPDLIPASIKSTLIDPQVSSRLLSTKNVSPSCSYFASVSFGSSRASPRDGPAQPPDIRDIRSAESILFCSMYVFRFCVANSVTSNITYTPCLLFNLNVCLFSYQIIKPTRKVTDKPIFTFLLITVRNIHKYVNRTQQLCPKIKFLFN